MFFRWIYNQILKNAMRKILKTIPRLHGTAKTLLWTQPFLFDGTQSSILFNWSITCNEASSRETSVCHYAGTLMIRINKTLNSMCSFVFQYDVFGFYHLTCHPLPSFTGLVWPYIGPCHTTGLSRNGSA